MPKSSGTDLGSITNNSSYIRLLYGDGVDRYTSITLDDTAIGLYVYNSSGETDIAIDDSGITITADDIKWNNKTLATVDQIPTAPVEDVKVGTTNANATSVVSSKNAVLLTKTAYNASSNKLATESDIPVVEAITSAELALILV